MTTLVTIIHVVVCFMLIGVILLQAGRGSGLAGASFGGGNVQSLFGTKGSEFLQKATTGAAILFVLTCLTLNIMETQKSRSLLETGSRPAPMDMDQVQKALEEMKRQAGEEGTAAEAQGVMPAAAQETTQQMQAQTEGLPAAVGETGGEAAAQAEGSMNAAAGQEEEAPSR